MRLIGALLVVFWWICLWGLADILTENWTREERIIIYTAGVLFVTAVAVLFPQLWDRL
jgi:threonine/homoserine/homoserine lactone efflux protein